MESADTATDEKTGVIENVGLLDLTGMSSERLGEITRIQNVGLVLVPEGMESAVHKVARNVGATVPVPQGAKLNVISGQAIVGGEVFANPDGDENAIMVVSGQLIVTSPVTEVGYRGVIVSGQIVAPKMSQDALSRAITRLAGQMVLYPYTEGMSVQVRAGQTKLSGEALANPGGQESDVLLALGQFAVTSPIEKIGFKEILIFGQAVAPRESQGIFSSHTGSSAGQIGYYSGTNPRFFMGNDRFAAGFFELLPEPATLVLLGDYTIEPDVTIDLLREKVPEIALLGKLHAPRSLVPMLQVLAVENLGQISALEDEERDG